MTRRALRTVALVGHRGAGVAELIDVALAAADQPDADPQPEAPAGHGEALVPARLVHRGVAILLLDGRGGPAVAAALRAADAALFVVSAQDGLDAATGERWQECAELGLPRAVVVTGLDEHLEGPGDGAGADFEEVVAICQRVLVPDAPDSLVALQLPMAEEDGSVAGLLELLGPRVVDHSGGGRRERAPDPEHLPHVAARRALLVEAVLAEADDDALLDRYLAGQDLDAEALAAELHRAVARGSLHPVLATAGARGVGVQEVLDLVVDAFPGPAEHVLPALSTPAGLPLAAPGADPDAPLLAEVLAPAPDPHGPALVRVLAGTLRAGDRVHATGRRGDEVVTAQGRVGALVTWVGRSRVPVAAVGPGELCTATGLGAAAAGDAVSGTDPVLLAPWGG